MDELYIDNLDEYIQDEGQLVTYKWLSLTLNVPSNTAKQMLFHYVNQRRSLDKNVKLNVTYLISGVIYDEDLKQDIHKVCVACESKLNDLKETFKRIFSIHFYSVQKAQLHDLNLLYAADYDKVTENIYEASKYSGIICPSIQTRSSDEITSLKSKLAYKSSSPTKGSLGKVKPALDTKQNVIDSENKENKFDANGKLQETEHQNNMQQKKNVTKGSKGGIASMFANQTKKNEDKKELDCASRGKAGNIKVQFEEDKKPKKGTLSGFFTKGKTVNQKTQDPVIKEEFHANKKVEDALKIEVKTEFIDEEENPLAKSPIKVETKDCVESRANSNTKSNHEEKIMHHKPKISSKNRKGCRTYSGKRKPKNETTLSNNKRRRIMAMDSSSESSSEEAEEEMDEDPMPAPLSSTIESDDDDDVIPLTPQNNLIDVAEMAKIKKRKLVSKTFTDAQGFFVTKKEYELTSDCSDDENPLPSSKVIKSPTKQFFPAKKQTWSPKKKRKSPVTSKKNSPVKRVQASITSFFKRN